MGTISNSQGFNANKMPKMVLKPNRFDKLFASGFHFPCLTLRPLSFKCVVKCGFLLHPQTKGQIKQRKNFWTLRHRPRPFFSLGDCGRFSGMNATPGKPGAPPFGSEKLPILSIRSLRVFTPLYGYLRHSYAYFRHLAHVISAKFVILNAVVVFFA